jgi:hypothetical protein
VPSINTLIHSNSLCCMSARGTHRRYREFGEIAFEDEHGRQYMPARDHTTGEDGMYWQLDVRIPISVAKKHVQTTRLDLEFAQPGSNIRFFRKGNRTGRPIAEGVVLAHESDNNITSSGSVCVQKIGIYDYEAMGRAFALSPAASPLPGGALARAEANLAL